MADAIKPWTDHQGRTIHETIRLVKVGREGHKTHRARVLHVVLFEGQPGQRERIISAHTCCQSESRRGRMNLPIHVLDKRYSPDDATCEWCKPKTQEL